MDLFVTGQVTNPYFIVSTTSVGCYNQQGVDIYVANLARRQASSTIERSNPGALLYRLHIAAHSLDPLGTPVFHYRYRDD